MAAVNRAQRAAVAAAYFVAFWVALPAGLWWAGWAVDRTAGWDRQIVWWGFLPLAVGAPLLARAVCQLRHEGGGLPIGALPPPYLASRGPYAWVRHPIYEGFTVALLGGALLIGSPFTLVLSARPRLNTVKASPSLMILACSFDTKNPRTGTLT